MTWSMSVKSSFCQCQKNYDYLQKLNCDADVQHTHGDAEHLMQVDGIV